MTKTFVVILLLGLLASCNQHMGHAVGAGAQYSKPAPAYQPPPPVYQPITIIGPGKTLICNRVGNLITCY